MNGSLQKILYDTETKIGEYRKKMAEFEKNPMILVTDIFKEHDLLLPILMQLHGDEVLLEMQEYWFYHFLPAFQTYLGVEGIWLDFDPTIYPAPIQIYDGEDLIALLEIVTHQYQRKEPQQIVEIRNEIERLQRQRKDLEQELLQWEPALKNPLVLGGANIFKLTDIAFRTEKYSRYVRNQVSRLQNELLDYDRQITQLKVMMEEEQRLNVERELKLERIERRIMQLPGYNPADFEDTTEGRDNGDGNNDNNEEY